MPKTHLSAQEILAELDLERFLSSAQAAQFLGTHRTYIYVLVRQQRLPAPIRISLLAGSSPILIHRKSDLETYKAAHPRLGQRRQRA